jgi:CRISPR-associated protein Cas1
MMSILPSHKYGIEYIEHCSVRAADEQLAFIRKKDAVQQHFNIPVANTAVLLLGPGTSLTQQAARLCAQNNVLVGFCAGGASPVYLASLNEYREPRYSREWIAMWNDETRRLAAAKSFQHARVRTIAQSWKNFDDLRVSPDNVIRTFLHRVEYATNTDDLLTAEGHFTKELYALLAENFGAAFTRKPRSNEFANEFLDNGNYLAYGLGAACLWVLGIPFSYPLVHGKTRRGALVFDVADIIKDAYIMPNAFLAAAFQEKEGEARRRMLATLHDTGAFVLLFKEVLRVIGDDASKI